MMRKMIVLTILLMMAAGPVLAAKIVPLDLFKPFRMRVDGERIFIGQEAVIFIYSAKDHKLLGKFGKPGEGPQEFKLYPEMSPDFEVRNNTITALSIGKVSFFTTDGKFLEEKKIPGGRGNEFFRKLGDKLLAEKMLAGEDKVLYKAVILYDSNLKKIKEIFRYKYHAQPGKQYNPIERGIYLPNFYICDNKIFIGGEIGKGTIHVFDIAGKPLYTIKPKMDGVSFTDADKKGYIDSFSLYPEIYERLKKRFKYSDHFPYFQNFVVTGDRIYLQTFKRNEKDTDNEIFILNLKGEILKRVWLPFDEYFDLTPSPYTFHGKKLYQCVDKEEEDGGVWELHITTIE